MKTKNNVGGRTCSLRGHGSWQCPLSRVSPHVPWDPQPLVAQPSFQQREWAGGLCVHMCASISLRPFTAPVTEEQHCVREKYEPQSQELQIFIPILYREPGAFPSLCLSFL